MAIYEVLGTKTVSFRATVGADSEDDAMEKANDQAVLPAYLGEVWTDDGEFEPTQVRKIGESSEEVVDMYEPY